MSYHVDIGSTSVKLFLPSGTFVYNNREGSTSKDILSCLEELLEANHVQLSDHITVSSSANGGIRVVLFSYSESLSGHVARSTILLSGCNIIAEHTLIDQLSNHTLALTDKVVIAVGTLFGVSDLQLIWVKSILSSLIGHQFNESNIILCAHIPEPSLICPCVTILPPLLTERLHANSSHLSNCLQQLYLSDLIDKKNILSVSIYLQQEIHPTPSVVGAGYNSLLCGSVPYLIGSLDSVWFDIGGATTDIYYPRLSISEQESSNLAGPPGNRHVLVSIGFHHSRSSTIKIATASPWYYDFVDFYNLKSSDAFSDLTSDIVALCILVAIFNACRDAQLSFPYPLNFDRISSFIVTGGGAHLIDKDQRKIVELYVRMRLDIDIMFTFDLEYYCLRVGHELL